MGDKPIIKDQDYQVMWEGGDPRSSADLVDLSEGRSGAQYTASIDNRASDKKVSNEHRWKMRRILKKKSATSPGEIEEMGRSVSAKDNFSGVYSAAQNKKSSDAPPVHMEANRTKIMKRLRLVKKTPPSKSRKQKPKEGSSHEGGNFTDGSSSAPHGGPFRELLAWRHGGGWAKDASNDESKLIGDRCSPSECLRSLLQQELEEYLRIAGKSSRCALCHFCDFYRPFRVKGHVENYHAEESSWRYTGKKQLRVCIALYDNDMMSSEIIAKPPSNYLRRSARIIREIALLRPLMWRGALLPLT